MKNVKKPIILESNRECANGLFIQIDLEQLLRNELKS